MEKNVLHYMYIVQNKTRKSISEETGVPEWKIKKFLQKYEIKKPPFQYHPNTQDKLWMEDQFVHKNRTIQSIADELGHSCDVISSCIKKMGISRNTKRNIDQRISDPIFLEKSLQSGMNQKELAAILGVSDTTMRMYLKKYGLTRTDRYIDGPYSKLYDVDWLTKERKTKTVYQIADELNIVQSTVSKACRDLDVNTKPPSNFSSYENEICAYLCSNGISYERRNRSILGGKELDIYIEKFNLAIEVNGNYWHSDHILKNKMYHRDKTFSCIEKGIRLLHIWEHDYIDDTKRQIIFKKIDSYCNISQEKIRASKCVVRKIDGKLYRDFLNSNHIQGSINSSIRYGMFYENDLVSVMGLGVPRYTNDFEYELLRYCTKNGNRVYGGGSKMFKFVLKDLGDDISVISYCDMSYGVGKMYMHFGMEYSHTTNPNYMYFKQTSKGFELVSRYRAQKHKLHNLLESFDDSLTEKENMFQNGYHIIYDSGNTVFVYNKKDRPKAVS